MTTTRMHDTRRLLARIGSVAATAGITFGVLLAAAPSAAAEPRKPIKESTIRSECKAAGGTDPKIDPGSGDHESTCSYQSIDGTAYADHYWNGVYTDTTRG